MITTWSVCVHPTAMDRKHDRTLLIECADFMTPIKIIDRMEAVGATVIWMMQIPNVTGGGE